MIGFNGGLIGKDRTTTLAAAVGVWTLDEQIKARRNAIWPGAGDADANNYIAAVEGDTGDNQALEEATKTAIQTFVQGCKGDGIWDAIKAACILAGARTLAGALKPLKGTAPINNGPFVAGDYDRKTGLVGNGSAKYLDSNRNNSVDLQNSLHQAVYIGTGATGLNGMIGIAGGGVDPGRDNHIFTNTASNVRLAARNRNSTAYTVAGSSSIAGFVGVSRSTSSTFSIRYESNSYTSSTSSTGSAVSATHFVFARNNNGSPDLHSSQRLAFYSIGESIDLALLDSRVATLITDIGAAF